MHVDAHACWLFWWRFRCVLLALPREQTFVLSAVRVFLIAHVTLSVVTVYEMLCTTLLSVFFVAFSFSV